MVNSQSSSHRLLKRQLRKLLGVNCATERAELPAELAEFVTAVECAYQQADEDRRLLERSIELSSGELNERNEALGARLKELEQTRAQLARSYSLLRSTIDSTTDAIVAMGPKMEVRAHNRLFSNLIEWDDGEDEAEALEERSGQSVLRKLLKKVIDRKALLHHLKSIAESPFATMRKLIELDDGRQLELVSIPQLRAGVVEGRVFSFHDLTEKLHDQETIRHLAYHDALTSLPNRILMNDRLDHAISRAHREKTGIAVFFLDLDNFKSVNDRLGHKVGDELLIGVAERMKQTLRASDTICRLGGDEFTVILENVAEGEVWRAIAQKLVDELSRAFDISGHEVWVGVSIGVGLYPRDASSAEDLVRHADMAMYRAKQEGRQRYVEFSSLLLEEVDRNSLIEVELRHAVARGELYVVYQPKYSLRNKEITGFEALLRWTNSRLGNVSPAEFIPIAEQCGVIHEIGMWVLREACKQLYKFHADGYQHVTMAVNLSVCQLQQQGLQNDIEHVLQSLSVPAEFIELEITESALMENVDGAIRLLKELRALGVSLSIDDFGSGYSSMSYLKNLPVQSLKIDRQFVQEIAESKADFAIVDSMVTLAHNLNLKVVAEGVENERSMQLLRELSCDFVQGFLLSKPISAADCKRLMQNEPLAAVQHSVAAVAANSSADEKRAGNSN